LRIPVRERQAGARFNITPLIDVVFLLVVFFLVATHFAHEEQVQALELPSSGTVSQESELPRQLTVSVLSDGSLHLKNRQVDLPEIESLIAEDTRRQSADYEVRIRADRGAAYEHVEPILLACLRAGVTRIAFAVLEE
jgi:biopolymer transport protein ExbD